MQAVQITRFGGPEVLEIVDIPEPTPGEGQQFYDVSTAGVNYADTHHHLSREPAERPSPISARAADGSEPVDDRSGPRGHWPGPDTSTDEGRSDPAVPGDAAGPERVAPAGPVRRRTSDGQHRDQEHGPP
jgi:hypothetical protein